MYLKYKQKMTPFSLQNNNLDLIKNCPFSHCVLWLLLLSFVDAVPAFPCFCPTQFAFATFSRSSLLHFTSRNMGLETSAAAVQEESTGLTATAAHQLTQLADSMTQRAQLMEPFLEEELNHVISSLITARTHYAGEDEGHSSNRFQAIRTLFSNVGHLSHKNWTRTGDLAAQLHPLLLQNHTTGLHPEFRDMFERVLIDGNWDAAASAAVEDNNNHSPPWVVLVTGVNGIRKTTSVYQPWFASLLREALIPPNTHGIIEANPNDMVPTGRNSFFRQLDHMIATLAHSYFQLLYRLTSQTHDFSRSEQPPKHVISLYSQFKAALFSRFRTVSEMIGVVLVREAIKRNMNIMIETSGRDIAMFHYVDTFFPSYRKLALHFTISDLSFAETSVDKRMIREMLDGIDALREKSSVQDLHTSSSSSTNISVKKIIRVNSGGPYGSEVLKAVQADSDKVWQEILGVGTKSASNHTTSMAVGQDWYKATIQIDAHATEPWTARAVKQDATLGVTYTFQPMTLK